MEETKNNNNKNEKSVGEDAVKEEKEIEDVDDIAPKGGSAMRPVFLGNLKPNFAADDILKIFEAPETIGTDHGSFLPIPVDRLDQKRGYCFVFLKAATRPTDKENAERFVAAISGMEIKNVSSALRAEFARGDGRLKRREDDRRKNIRPSDTLFVVNFSEATTKREDLQMLFEPYGDLLRIDMKRNYAFVQFKTTEEATKAKDATNGGRLEQSVLTVEFVARQRNYNDEWNGGRRGSGRYRDHRRGGSSSRYRDDRYNYREDRRGGGGYRDRCSDRDYCERGSGDRFSNDRRGRDDYRGGGRDRDDYRGGGHDQDDYRGPARDRSPDRGRRRSRSRSRSRSRENHRFRESPPYRNHRS